MSQSNIMHRLKRLARRRNLHASIRSLSAARHPSMQLDAALGWLHNSSRHRC
jgi:hypothetical protein